MSVAASDLQLYGSASMPEDDTSTSGGAIDLGTKVVFVPLAAADTINVVSDDAGDTDQTYTVHGYDAAGTKVTELFSLAGLTPDTGAQTFERITKIVKTSGSALAGTLTWTRQTGGSTIVTEESVADSAAGTEIDTVRTMFYNLASDPSAAKDAYEKVFMRNNNAATTLVDAVARLMDGGEDTATYDTTVDVTSAAGQKVLSVASTTGIISGDSVIINVGGARAEIHEVDSVAAGVSITLIDNLVYEHTAGQADAVNKCKFEFMLAAAYDDSVSVANRLTAPAGTFNGRAKNLPTSQNHLKETAIGIWVHAALIAADTPQKTECEIRESGNTV